MPVSSARRGSASRVARTYLISQSIVHFDRSSAALEV